MALSFAYSLWVLVVSLIVAAGLTYWTYRRTRPELAPRWRGLLGTLRFVSLAILCFLLLEPVVRHLNESEDPPLLAVLVDDTESMRVVAGGAADTTVSTTRDQIRPVLTSVGDDVPGTRRIFSFDDELRAESRLEADSFSFAGTRTDIAAALEGVADELDGENLQGVALISDGQYNTGQNPTSIADRYPVPIHTITVGDTTQERDLEVRRVTTSDRAYVDTEVPVRATIGTERLGDESTTVSLQRGDTILADTTLQLPAGTAELAVNLAYRPEQAGLQQLTVRASPVSGEATTRNNARSVSLRVLDAKRQVLLLGAAPSPSLATVRRLLARDANTSLTVRIPQQDGSFSGGPLPDSLSQFDVVVAAGFPSRPVPSASIRRIGRLLEEKTPALFLLDRQTDVSAWTEHFSESVPAAPPSTDVTFVEAQFEPVEAERDHSIFEIDGASPDRFDPLPPLAAPAQGWSPTPDATVLAHARRSDGTGRDPVLVVRRRAGHRTAAFLGTDTWRWTSLPPSLDDATALWPGLLSNLLRWVATQSDDRQVRVRPVATSFDGDQPVEFTGQVYDERMAPVPDATVEITILDSAGTEYPHTMEPIGDGRYALSVGSLPEGTYEYEAEAQRADRAVGSDRGEFSVGPLRLETQSTRADPVLMRQIAARSGGRSYSPSNAERLASQLDTSSAFTATSTTETTEYDLWRHPLLLVVLLLLLATEWTLRKRFGLT